jgi:hypothetical protein
MRIRALVLAVAALAAWCAGCNGKPAFPELHPVKGVVKRGGQPVQGGAVRFNPASGNQDFLINAEVGADGTYTLSTVRTTGSGERKPGAPAGSYRVTYTPLIADQTSGERHDPIDLPTVVTVKPGDNDIPIDLPKK